MTRKKHGQSVINVPFSSFYHSWHKDQIDYGLEFICEDHAGEIIDELQSALEDIPNDFKNPLYNLRAIENEYAKKYVNLLNGIIIDEYQINLNLKFKSVRRPSNTPNVTIYAHIGLRGLKRLWGLFIHDEALRSVFNNEGLQSVFNEEDSNVDDVFFDSDKKAKTAHTITVNGIACELIQALLTRAEIEDYETVITDENGELGQCIEKGIKQKFWNLRSKHAFKMEGVYERRGTDKYLDNFDLVLDPCAIRRIMKDTLPFKNAQSLLTSLYGMNGAGLEVWASESKETRDKINWTRIA